MPKLQTSYYLNNDVVFIAKDLIGKYLYTCIAGNTITGGIIIETEAYNGIIDKASHAYNNKRTKRTEVMYAKGGIAYVYLCYGMHALFNVVTNKQNIPHAILIRALYPTDGFELMLQRANKSKISNKLANGPGKVTKILGITTNYNGIALNTNTIWIEDKGIELNKNKIISTTRIGIDYAMEDALLSYRFYVDDDVISKIINK